MRLFCCFSFRSKAAPPHPPEKRDTRPTTTNPFLKSKKLTGSKPGSSKHWRPELSAISEDLVFARMVESKTEKKSSSTKSRSTSTKSRSFTYDNQYSSSRKSSVPMIIPSFSATPFMF